MITIAQPNEADATKVGQLPEGEGGVMTRGRAAAKLANNAPRRPWEQFTACPHEDLRQPDRVHVDYLGNLHLCQGLICGGALGNLFTTPLRQVCDTYTPDADPVIGPLLEGGPAGLWRAAMRCQSRTVGSLRTAMPTPVTCVTRLAWRCASAIPLCWGRIKCTGDTISRRLDLLTDPARD